MATQKQTRVLSTPKVLVNGRVIKVVPNSVKRKIPGQTSVRAVSAGGNAVEMVSGLNAEELKSTVSFDVANTAEMAELAEELRNLSNLGTPSTIKLVEDTKQEAFEQMFMTEAPEVAYEAEGNIPLEFEGKYVP